MKIKRDEKSDMEREALVWRVIGWLNDNPDKNGGFYDGKELGVLNVRWRHGRWDCVWIELEELPQVAKLPKGLQVGEEK